MTAANPENVQTMEKLLRTEKLQSRGWLRSLLILDHMVEFFTFSFQPMASHCEDEASLAAQHDHPPLIRLQARSIPWKHVASHVRSRGMHWRIILSDRVGLPRAVVLERGRVAVGLVRPLSSELTQSPPTASCP